MCNVENAMKLSKSEFNVISKFSHDKDIVSDHVTIMSFQVHHYKSELK